MLRCLLRHVDGLLAAAWPRCATDPDAAHPPGPACPIGGWSHHQPPPRRAPDRPRSHPLINVALPLPGIPTPNPVAACPFGDYHRTKQIQNRRRHHHHRSSSFPLAFPTARRGRRSLPCRRQKLPTNRRKKPVCGLGAECGGQETQAARSACRCSPPTRRSGSQSSPIVPSH